MDKLKLTGRNQGRVFHSRLSRTCMGRAVVHITKQPNLQLKTRPKQLLGYLPLAFALTDTCVAHLFLRIATSVFFFNLDYFRVETTI